MPVTLLILIFIRPFISSLAFPDVNIIYSILFFFFLAVWITTRGIGLTNIKPIRNPLALFILALLVSLIFSRNKVISITELYKYITGLLLLLIIVSLNQKEKKRIILCIILASFFVSLLAMYQYFFGFKRLLGYIATQKISNPFILDYVSRKRVFSPFVTPNILGGYLAMIIPLTLSHRKTIWFVIPLVFALLLTKSIGAFISLFLGLLIYFYLSKKSGKRRIIFLFGLLLIITFVSFSRLSTQTPHIHPVFSTVMRLAYWKDTLEIIRQSPFTGIGLGNFDLLQSRYAHNTYLQVWAEMGILGVISILWLVVALFKSARNHQAAGLMAASSIFLIHNLVDFSFFLPEVALIWWIISGLILSKDMERMQL